MADRADLREAETAFGTFWAAYPRKVAKMSASIAFVKALRKTTLPVMLDALDWQRHTAQWQRGIIPNASTWLHQERWNDEGPSRMTKIEPPADVVELAKSIARSNAEHLEHERHALQEMKQQWIARGLSDADATFEANREWFRKQS